MDPFSWMEGRRLTAQRRSTAIGDAFHNAKRCANEAVYTLIADNNLDINTECFDEYRNTLLHIVVATKNHRLAKSLLIMGADIQIKNMFGETPLDIGIKNHHTPMIKILLEFNPTVGTLRERVDELEAVCDEVERDCEVLHNRVEGLQSENAELSLKRKRCERCPVHESQIKKLKIDNKQLTTDNAELSKSIEAMRESFKKP